MIIQSDLIAEIARYGMRIPNRKAVSAKSEKVFRSLYELSFSVFDDQIMRQRRQCDMIHRAVHHEFMLERIDRYRNGH